jgi:D-glycero-D-manno-heptose 1,7-bisphosphate phosphatase
VNSRAVFLDRDNTLIDNDGDLGDPAAVHLRPGAESLSLLADAGFRIVVVSNQGGVARGCFTEGDVRAVNERIGRLVDEATGRSGLIERFYFCPYHPQGTVRRYRREHPWRKPAPGMLLAAGRDLGLDLRACWLIGDQHRDVAAGAAAGCSTVLLCAGPPPPGTPPTATAPGLREAVRVVLAASAKGRGA